MTDPHERHDAAAGDIPAAAPDVAEVVEAEVVDAEVVEEEPVDGEVPAESAEAAGEGADDGAAVDADLTQLLSETAQERDQYLELAQRTRADFDNYRKRMTAEVTAAGTRARVELATGLIGVLDNLENALAAAGVDPAAALVGETETEGHLEQGIVLTYRELVNVLMRGGVQPYDPAGEQFDPTWHEALQTRPADGAATGTVVDVIQKGYRVDDQVIRAARVVVAE